MAHRETRLAEGDDSDLKTHPPGHSLEQQEAMRVAHAVAQLFPGTPKQPDQLRLTQL